jgi:cobalt-zinc-cadmium efflux system outer membrane protein
MMQPNRPIRSIALGFLLCAAASVADAAAPAPAPLRLSLTDAVSMAQARSPLTREAEARVSGATARLRGARALASPGLGVAHGWGRDTGGLDEDITLSQTIELGGKRGLRVQSAKAERDASASDRAATALDLVLSVRSAYYDALLSDEEYGLAADSLATARRFSEAAETQFQAGDVPRSNVLRTGIELTRAEQALAAAETERGNRYAALRSLLGVDEGTTLTLTDTLEFQPAAYQLAELQSLALRNRPDLQAARLLVESLRASLQGARAESRPDFFVEARRASVEPGVQGASIRFGLAAPLFDLGRQKADVAAAQAALAEQQARLEEATRTAGLEIETALRNLEQAQSAVESFQTGRLSRAEDLLEMAQTGYDKGAISYLEVLDAQQVYRSEQGDYARALAAYNAALAALERAVGGHLR